jgi:hypothetical protein
MENNDNDKIRQMPKKKSQGEDHLLLKVSVEIPEVAKTPEDEEAEALFNEIDEKAVGPLIRALYEAVEIRGEYENHGEQWSGDKFDQYYGGYTVSEMDDEWRVEDYEWCIVVEACPLDQRTGLRFETLELDHVRDAFDECEQAMLHYDNEGIPRFFFGGTLNGVQVLLLFYPWSREEAVFRPKSAE